MVTIMPRQQQGIMLGPMRGHMAPNSSPFKPTINKLSSQYLIQDHMSNHYMKIGTAKSAIDSKPPKSMTNSVKKRDQMKREAMAKQMKLFDFEKEMKHGNGTTSRQSYDSSVYGSQRLLSVTVTKNGLDEPRPQSVSSYRSSRLSPRPSTMSARPRSASTSRSNPTSPRDKTVTIRKPDVLTQTYGGDYLDRHEDRFKNVDVAFTPRLKKREGKSFLSQSKHYAPPLVVSKEKKRKVASKKHVADDISPSSSTSSIYRDELETTDKHTTNAETMEEQTQSLSRLSLDSKKTYDNIYPDRKYTYDAYGFRHDSTADTLFGTSSFRRNYSRSDAFSPNMKHRIEVEEEEMKYLEFINSVTNDILTRGIYSDRVLTQVMERHLNQNKGRLDERRMRKMLRKLQEDLGVSTNEATFTYETAPKYIETNHHMSFEYDNFDKSVRPKSRTLTKKKSYDKSSSDGNASDNSEGRPKRKGILKTPATSSGSEMDIRSALSDEEEKPNAKHSEVENAVDDQSLGALGSTATDEQLFKDTNSVISSSPVAAKRTVSIEKGISEIMSLKSISSHSLGSLPSDDKINDKTDLDDF